MKTRIIAGICMLPLLLIVWYGSWPLVIAAFAIAVIGVTEFYHGFEAIDVHPNYMIAYIMAIFLYGVHILIGSSAHLVMLWFAVAIMASLLYGLNITKRGPYDAIATLAGIMYIVFFPYHIVLLDDTYYSIMVWMVLIAAFGSDIFAYFTGYFFGKHKMAPNLSPKKTVEGAVGGVLGAGVLGLIFGLLFAKQLLIHCVIVGVLGGCISECGDLVASSFKRKMGIKDYGHLIPGHGGIMDRFDSVIFVAPVVYYYVVLVLIRPF